MTSTPGDPEDGAPSPPPEPPTQPLGHWEQQAAQSSAQQPPPGPPGAPGYGYPPQYPAYHPADHPKAATALVLGLVGIIGGLTCFLPLFLGPWAWSIGRRAVREIDAEPQRYGGRGQAMAGYVLGIVCTVLLALGILAAVAALVLALAFAGFSSVDGVRI